MLRGLVVFLGTVCLLGQQHERLELSPLDLQGGGEEYYLSALNQMVSNGRHFFLCGPKETKIVQMDRQGRVVRTIGGPGEHPAEFGFSGVLAMAVAEDRLWAIDMEVKRVRLFVNGHYQNSHRLDSFNISYPSPAANTFTFSDQFVVIPSNVVPNRLAHLYGSDGQILDLVGEPMDFSSMFNEFVLGLNDVHWLAYGKGWISVHKFFPLITIYDQNFGQVSRFQIESPIVQQVLDNIFAASDVQQNAMPVPVFSDAKMFRGHLYLMCKGFLHRIDPQNQQLLSLTSFYGRGDDFAEVREPQVTVYYFAFLDDGFLLLGHPAMLWNHDLWTPKKPMLAAPGG